MFSCGLNLNKTMGSSIYGHKEVGIWRIFLSLDVVTIPYAHNQVWNKTNKEWAKNKLKQRRHPNTFPLWDGSCESARGSRAFPLLGESKVQRCPITLEQSLGD